MCIVAAAPAAGVTASMAMAANVSLALAAVGTAMSAYGMYQQGQAAKKQAEYQASVSRNNQAIAEQNAKAALARGEAEEERHRDKVSLLHGRQTSLLSAGGVDISDPDSSAVDVLVGTMELGELDAQTIRHNSEMEAREHRVRGMNFGAEAGLNSSRATAAGQAGTFGAATSLLSGAGSVADKWYRLTG